MPLTFRTENDIGFITFDQKDSKVNLLTAEAIQRLDAVLDEARNNPDLRALVIISGKPDVFIAGADIKEIERITVAAEGQAKAGAGQKVLNKLEDLTIPTVAVIDGIFAGAHGPS